MWLNNFVRNSEVGNEELTPKDFITWMGGGYGYIKIVETCSVHAHRMVASVYSILRSG